MKRILVVDTAASGGGALTVLQDFYKAVVEYESKDIEWIFLVSGPYIEAKTNIKIIIKPSLKPRLNRLAFDYITGRKFVEEIKPNLVLSFQNTIIRGANVPQVVYVHQPVPFQSTYKFSFLKKEERSMAIVQYLLGGIIKSSVSSADLVIVQTKWMKNAILQQCEIEQGKVLQIYPTVNKIDLENACRYQTTNIFFYPTSDAYYKNINTLLEACRKLDLCYHLNLTVDGQSTEKISFLGRLSREDVLSQYKNSCLVFPSYIETFGYPLIEAKKMGAIILASDCEFSHELLDGYSNAYFFNPFDSLELSRLMENVASGKITRKKVFIEMDKGDDNSWDKVIDILRRRIGIF
ncbi:glycosyltransferase [Selenomonas ruminantium]|uniref:glycosyltransferase n=1 Tax=Selenomonas ruminantium TaxID=971 RepID=UPI0003F86F89|nr:glycosyltransferase [Selenomonas ruminantium]